MSNKLGISKISANMNISIPKKVQEKLGGLEKGQYVIFVKDRGKIYIKKGLIKTID